MSLTLTPVNLGKNVFCSESLACSDSRVCGDTGLAVTPLTAGSLVLVPITP